MSEAAAIDKPEILTTADGTPLKISLARALRREKLRAFALIVPLILFITITFIIPIGSMMWRGVENPLVTEHLPRTVALLEHWDPQTQELPDESTFEALALDIKEGAKERVITRVGARLNYEYSGMASLFRKSQRRVPKIEEGPYREALFKVDKRWAKPEIWHVIRTFSPRYTAGYFLAALDLQVTPEGDIEFQDEDRRLYLGLFLKTMLLSAMITLFTLILGYPIAYLLATLKLRTSNLLLMLVLLPFWTSLLVRTTSWIALLQREGVINDFLVALHLIGDDGRLAMIHNATGTIIAMTHILLPFMILPLFSVMKTISPSYMRAAVSLGAHPWSAFWKIYVPNTLPGVGAGGILVFIISIGYYITPALVGGTSGTFISNLIAYHISSSLNWGLAAALGVLLLGLVLVLYLLYDKFVGIDNMKLG